MALFTTEPRQIKKSISYGTFEKERIFRMEEELMEHHGYNFSQLHKCLVRDAYRQLRMI
tara:strand:- start:546 stop:722 length:177 start_codon:yes stop_codon:yes gene_type:complete